MVDIIIFAALVLAAIVSCWLSMSFKGSHIQTLLLGATLALMALGTCFLLHSVFVQAASKAA